MSYYDETYCKCGKHISGLSSESPGWDCDYKVAIELNGYDATKAYRTEHGKYPIHVIPGARERQDKKYAVLKVLGVMEKEGVSIADIREHLEYGIGTVGAEEFSFT